MATRGGPYGEPVWREPEDGRQAKPNTLNEDDSPTLDDRHGRMLTWLQNRRERRRDRSDRVYMNRQRYDGTRGRHWMRYNPADGWLVREAVPRYRVQWTAPNLISRGETFVSLVGTSPIMYGAAPASNDPDDRESASATTKYLRALANDEKLALQRMQAARLGYVDGMCYVMAYWDNAARRARIRVLDVESVFVEPTATEVENSPVLCIETWPHIEQFKADFPDAPNWKDVNPLASEIPPATRRLLLASEDMSPYGYSGTSDSDLEGVVARREFYIPPSPKRPRGQFVVMCNNIVIYDSETKRAKPGQAKPGLPYIDAGIVYPVHAFRYKVVPGNFYGLSAVELMWDNVRIKERIVSQMLEGIALAVRPKVLVGRTTNIEGRFTQEPGEVWAYDSAAGEPAPTLVTWPAPDPSVWNAVGFMDLKDDDTIGINSASAGQMPARVDSGRAIKLLQNADLGVAQIAALYLDDAFSAALWDAVRLEKTYGSGERVRQVIGTTNSAEIVAFTNETFKGTANVWVKSSPFMGYSPAMLMEEAKSLLQLGVFDFNDFRDAVALAPSDAAQSSEYAINKEQAAAENFRMERGEMVEVRPFEMNAVHARAHRIFLQSKWDVLTPEARQIFMQHIQLTELGALTQKLGEAEGVGALRGTAQPQSDPGAMPQQEAAPQGGMEMGPSMEGDAGSAFNGGVA